MFKNFLRGPAFVIFTLKEETFAKETFARLKNRKTIEISKENTFSSYSSILLNVSNTNLSQSEQSRLSIQSISS